MPARTNRIRHDDQQMRFYVYRLFDGETTLYVGKGSGRRLCTQMRRHNCSGEILERFKDERAAYQYEIKLIAELAPRWNIHKGGNGSCAQKKPPRRKYGWELEMHRVGIRVYAARLLLRKAGLPFYLSREKIAGLRLIAATA